MQSPSLPEVQSAFVRSILDDDAAVLRFLDAPSTRFRVYRACVLANLQGALRDIYPIVLRLTGERFFNQVTRQYALERPSVSGDLHRFGATFPQFLAGYGPASDHIYLPDVARLEWLWHEAFHAADTEPMDIAALAQVAPAEYGRLRFRLQAACRLFRSAFPVHRIWETNQSGYVGEQVVGLDEGAARVVVYRVGFEVRMVNIPEADHTFVASLAAAQSFAQATAGALAIDSHLNIEDTLRRLVSEQIVTGFSLNEADQGDYQT